MFTFIITKKKFRPSNDMAWIVQKLYDQQRLLCRFSFFSLSFILALLNNQEILYLKYVKQFLRFHPPTLFDPQVLDFFFLSFYRVCFNIHSLFVLLYFFQLVITLRIWIQHRAIFSNIHGLLPLKSSIYWNNLNNEFYKKLAFK